MLGDGGIGEILEIKLEKFWEKLILGKNFKKLRKIRNFGRKSKKFWKKIEEILEENRRNFGKKLEKFCENRGSQNQRNFLEKQIKFW